eukprot:m.135606 g.135606  ORF g.135606 m.135606 type:complete len:297 (-) comp13979_c3_seq1:158-1048(-)
MLRCVARCSTQSCVAGVSAFSRWNSVLAASAGGRFNNVFTSVPTSMPEGQFGKELEVALGTWKEAKRSAAWLHIAPEDGRLIPIALAQGFHIHHGTTDRIAMMQWLRTDIPCMIPAYATHNVGVAGLVLNDRQQVLAIRERVPLTPGYKLPGGVADLGEDFGVTAEREVFEETGVRARFHSIVGMRHLHGFRHGLSDIYIICRCVAESDEINMCERELSEAKWLDIDEYCDNTISMGQHVVGTVRDAVKANPDTYNTAFLDCDWSEEEMSYALDKKRTFKLYSNATPRSAPQQLET